jgi:hypothetical protein
MLVPVEEIEGGDEQDTALLLAMAGEAIAFLNSKHWCPTIRQTYFADGYGGIFALFVARLSEPILETAEWLWIVVGDVPTVYMVLEPEDNARWAADRYCSVIGDWIDAVLGSGNFDDVYPVGLPRTEEEAMRLKHKLDTLRENLIPHLRDDPLEYTE